jgi:hypothetical protein
MALRIIGIDHGSKEDLVKECGAEVFLDITKFDDKTLAEEVKKATGGKNNLPLRYKQGVETRELTFFRSWRISCNCLHGVKQGLRTSS